MRRRAIQIITAQRAPLADQLKRSAKKTLNQKKKNEDKSFHVQ
jgi:hypothetical protein